MDNPTIPAEDSLGDHKKTGGFRLLVISNETRILCLLPERGTVIVGRSSNCDVRIADVALAVAGIRDLRLPLAESALP